MSKKSKDPLGDRQKHYELCSSQTLISGTPKIIRLDGKAFHSWTKKAKCVSPFDERMMICMAYAAEEVMNEIGGSARFAFIQSDECSIVINDKLDINSDPWFGNKLSKMTSVSASIMSVNFTLKWLELTGMNLPAFFDSRVIQLPSVVEMHNNVLWRQFDASKNSISQYARYYFSHKQLHGKSGSQMQDMMMLEKGFNWNNAPSWTKRGILLARFTPDDIYYEQGIEPFLTTDKKMKQYWDIPQFNKEQHYLSTLYKNYEVRLAE